MIITIDTDELINGSFDEEVPIHEYTRECWTGYESNFDEAAECKEMIEYYSEEDTHNKTRQATEHLRYLVLKQVERIWDVLGDEYLEMEKERGEYVLHD